MVKSSSVSSLTGPIFKIAAFTALVYVLDRTVISIAFQHLVRSDVSYLQLPASTPHFISNALGYLDDSTISSPLVPILFALIATGIALASNNAVLYKLRHMYLAMMCAFAASIGMILISIFNAYSLLGEMYFELYTPSEWKNLVAVIFLAVCVISMAAFSLMARTFVKNEVTNALTGFLLVIGIVPFTFGLLAISVVSGNYYAAVWIWLTLAGVCLPVALWKLSQELR
jgi:hypothetical protein